MTKPKGIELSFPDLPKCGAQSLNLLRWNAVFPPFADVMSVAVLNMCYTPRDIRLIPLLALLDRAVSCRAAGDRQAEAAGSRQWASLGPTNFKVMTYTPLVGTD